MIVQDDDSEKDWAKAVEIDPKSNGDNFYSGKHTLTGLEPATRYLARVSSKNDYGFNKFSQPFHFATKGAGKNRIYLYCHLIVFIESSLSLGLCVTLFMIYEQEFGISVNPIPIRGVDYAHHITACPPPGFENLSTPLYEPYTLYTI